MSQRGKDVPPIAAQRVTLTYIQREPVHKRRGERSAPMPCEPRSDPNQAKCKPSASPRQQRHTDAQRSIAHAAKNTQREVQPKSARKNNVLRNLRKRTERIHANGLARGSLGVAASLGLA